MRKLSLIIICENSDNFHPLSSSLKEHLTLFNSPQSMNEKKNFIDFNLFLTEERNKLLKSLHERIMKT